MPHSPAVLQQAEPFPNAGRAPRGEVTIEVFFDPPATPACRSMMTSSLTGQRQRNGSPAEILRFLTFDTGQAMRARTCWPECSQAKTQGGDGACAGVDGEQRTSRSGGC